MKKQEKKGTALGAFNKFSQYVTKAAGSPYAFLIASILVIVWAILGPVFGFSDTWQLVINTGTTIITFLMVFIIQQSQNKDTVAIQLKLNELLAAKKEASNRLINIEDLTEDELDKIKKFYIRLAELADEDDESLDSHTQEEARQNHEMKKKERGKHTEK